MTLFIPFLRAAKMLGVNPKKLPELEAEYQLKRIEFEGQKRSCVIMYLRQDVERALAKRASS